MPRPRKKCTIRVSRDFKKPDYTIGKMYINDVYFCDTLEDTDRGLKKTMSLDEIKKIKIYGKTAIPVGEYKVIMNQVSEKYKTREAYKFCGGRLPRLEEVPGFTGILIHIGNTPEDTEGCILVGENKEQGKVLNSTATFKKLYGLLEKFEDIRIKISSV